MSPEELRQMLSQVQQGQPGGPQGQASGIGGSSMPVPNRGLEAAALSKLAVHVQAMQTILAVLPAGGRIASDLRKAINMVAKHVPPGAQSQGAQTAEAERALMQARQMRPQMAAQQASQGPPPMMAGGQPGEMQQGGGE